MPTTYKQGDSRYATKIVGFGGPGQNFRNVGCTVCDITYLYNLVTNQDLRPDEINNRLKALGQYDKKKNPQGAFIGASVVWSNVQRALWQLQFVYRDYNYNNPLVWAWINIWPKLPVLVEVVKPESVTKRGE